MERRVLNQDVPDDVVLRLVRNSYDLIVAKLTKKERVEFANAASLMTDTLDEYHTRLEGYISEH